MKTVSPLLAFLFNAVIAHPTVDERDFQSVHLVFHAAAAQYEMTFPADGQKYYTGESYHL